MMSAVSRSSSSRPRGTLRCVERCWPSAAQARRSETCSLAGHARCRRGDARGLEVSPGSLLQDQLVQRQIRRPPGAAARSPPPAPSAASPGRSSARRTPAASGSTSPPSRRSSGSPRQRSAPATPARPPAAAWRRSPQACGSSSPSRSSSAQSHTSGRTTSKGEDHPIEGGYITYCAVLPPNSAAAHVPLETTPHSH